MPSAILCISGSELTRGETKDLNGSFLGAHITSLGVRVVETVLVPDDPDLLLAAVRGAIERADLVVMSGGLGPTADDHTVAVLSRLFARAIIRHVEARRRMRERALARGFTDETIPDNFYKQSEVIEGAEVLLNPEGLAPGMIIRTARGLLAVLPGVPREMQVMFTRLVVPRLGEHFRLEPPRILRAKIMGMGESWAEGRIQKLGIDFGRLEYGISAKPGELLVKFTAHRGEDHAELERTRVLLEREFREDFIPLPEGLLAPDGAALETDHAFVVHTQLLAAKATVAAAESCTGGQIAKELTDHAGSSEYFLGGVVAYSNRIKEELLGVPHALIEAHGAVSDEVCASMARGALERFGADYAVATTGIAGPGGGTEKKPVGLVYLAVAARKAPATPAAAAPFEVTVERQNFRGSRAVVRQLATVRALDLLRRQLENDGR